MDGSSRNAIMCTFQFHRITMHMISLDPRPSLTTREISTRGGRPGKTSHVLNITNGVNLTSMSGTNHSTVSYCGVFYRESC